MLGSSSCLHRHHRENAISPGSELLPGPAESEEQLVHVSQPECPQKPEKSSPGGSIVSRVKRPGKSGRFNHSVRRGVERGR